MSPDMQSNNLLPAEVIDIICQYLARPDLRVLRIASKHTQPSAERVLFRTIYLHFNLKSFKRLESIIEHSRLREYVRVLDYDGRQVGDESVGGDAGVWKQRNAGQGMGFLSEDRQRFASRFNRQRRREFYVAYLEYISGQQFLLDDDNSKRLLASAILKIPGLQSIRYSAACSAPSYLAPFAWNGTLPRWEDLSPIAQEILEEPEGYRSFGIANFWHLVEPLCGSTVNPKLLSIHGKDMELIRWNQTANRIFPNGFRNFSSLEHLGLEFNSNIYPRGSQSKLSEVFLHLPALRSLRLAFSPIQPDDMKRAENLEEILGKASPFPHLQSFSIEGVKAPYNFLLTFLSNHSQTLRSVKLSHISLWDPAPQLLQSDDSDTAAPKPNTGSFFALFWFMRRTLSLEQVKFNGSLCNASSGVYSSSELDRRGKAWKHDCIKYKIERFITKGKEWPLFWEEGDKGDYMDEYATQGDYSWKWI
jgi:hypothetical protein